jgi:cytochrome c peroxidase
MTPTKRKRTRDERRRGWPWRGASSSSTASRATSRGSRASTTDPGRALITGKRKHIGRFKGPILRGLAARAPYFHNGSAATLADAVQFYNDRFSIGLTQAEASDLVAFLRVQ